MRKILMLIFFISCSSQLVAQDPKFSQYFAAPLSLNPAFTGFFDGEYRFAANTRQQWGNLGDPYNTYSISGDVKLQTDENFTNSVFSLGLSGLFDESFNKALKSQYISASFSYYQFLDVEHRFKFGLAPQVSYVSRYLDYNKLTFASQYSDGTFDSNLPSFLDVKNDKTSYFDLNLGANFSAMFDRLSLVAGYAHYHLTKPQESLLGSNTQSVPYRKSVNLSMLYLLNNFTDLNVTGVYSAQNRIKDTIIGTVLGFQPNEENKIKLNVGLWYRINEASMYPYIGATFGNITTGLNYTVYGTKLMASTPRTYELSFIYRHNHSKAFSVPCPKF